MRRMPGDPSQYDDFEASELYCNGCKKSQPVRKHLLLVLPQGNKYEYRCTVCGGAAGEKMDREPGGFSVLTPS